MIYILFFSLLSVAAPAFASQNGVKDIGIIVTFCSRLTQGSMDTSGQRNLKQCSKLGIRGDLQEPFIFIDEIKDIIINNKVCAGFSNPYYVLTEGSNCHVVDQPIGNVWFYDQQTRSPIYDFYEIEVLKKENENIIRFMQKEGSGFFAIPVRLLTAQLSNSNTKEDKIVFHRAPVRIGQETCNITMSVLRDQLEQIPFADRLQDFEKKNSQKQASSKAVEFSATVESSKTSDDQKQEGKIRGCSPEGQMLFYIIDNWNWRYFVGSIGGLVGLVIFCNLYNKVKSS